jgi:hypothetical protein
MNPLKYPHASANHVLDHMKPEMFYTSLDLAESFNVPKQYMQDLLWRMARAGDVERIRFEDRTLVWARIVKRAMTDQNTSVAGPAYPPDLKSTMHGYDAQFRDRMQLAMMGRGR